jgi:hypothetical protein
MTSHLQFKLPSWGDKLGYCAVALSSLLSVYSFCQRASHYAQHHAQGSTHPLLADEPQSQSQSQSHNHHTSTQKILYIMTEYKRKNLLRQWPSQRTVRGTIDSSTRSLPTAQENVRGRSTLIESIAVDVYLIAHYTKSHREGCNCYKVCLAGPHRSKCGVRCDTLSVTPWNIPWTKSTLRETRQATSLCTQRLKSAMNSMACLSTLGTTCWYDAAHVNTLSKPTDCTPPTTSRTKGEKPLLSGEGSEPGLYGPHDGIQLSRMLPGLFGSNSLRLSQQGWISFSKFPVTLYGIPQILIAAGIFGNEAFNRVWILPFAVTYHRILKR